MLLAPRPWLPNPEDGSSVCLGFRSTGRRTTITPLSRLRLLTASRSRRATVPTGARLSGTLLSGAVRSPAVRSTRPLMSCSSVTGLSGCIAIRRTGIRRLVTGR